MRLTLRTLLAWMDGLLPPADAAEIAAKVEASVAAQRLADRIRDALQRTDLTAVNADPNAVAAYLDNRLPVAELIAFERACLESPAQLAEVASCHRVLAESLAAAATVAPRPPGDCKLDLTDPPRPLGRAEEPVLGSPASPATPVARRKPASRAAWVSALSGVLLLALVGGVFGWSVLRKPARRGPRPGPNDVAVDRDPVDRNPVERDPVERDPVERDAVERDAVERDAVNSDGVPQPPTQALADGTMNQHGANQQGANQQGANQQEPGAAEATPHDQAAPDEPEVPPTSVAAAEPAWPPELAGPADPAGPPELVGPAMQAEPRVPFGDALAIVAPSPVAADSSPVVPDARGPDPRQAPETEPDSADTPRVVVGPGFLRRSDAGDGPPWEAVTSGQPLVLPASLVAPACGRPVFVVDGIQVSVSSGTQLVLSRDAGGVPRLTIGFGGATISADRPDASLGLTAGECAGVATLGPAISLGVRVALVRAPGADPEEPAERVVQLVTLTAPVAWRQTAVDGGPAAAVLRGLEPEQRIPPRTVVEWTSRDPATASVRSLPIPPPWLSGSADRLDRAAADALARRLADGGPPLTALRELTGTGRSETRLAAAATLALVGDYEEAARMLCADLPDAALREEQWRTLEHAVVPLALARGPRAAAALAEALAAQLPAGRGADLARLVGGMSDESLAGGGDALLVAALDDPLLVVRRYASKNLVEITNPSAVDRLRYRPDRPDQLRREGVTWWRNQQGQGLVRRAAGGDPPPRQ